MKITGLRELDLDPSLPVTIKPFVHRELWERGDLTTKKKDETVYEIDEEDEEMIAEFEEGAAESDE